MLARRPIWLALLVSAGLITSLASASPDDPVVVRAGSSSMTASDVQRRLRSIPAYQLEQFGSSPGEVRRAFVEQVLVPELLYAEHARASGLAQAPGTWDRTRDILQRALDNQLRESLAKNPVTQAEIKQYYEANRSRFDTPRRIRIWRIVVDDEKLARRSIAAAKGDGGPKRWSELAREHSLDKATAMRDGDLGFVRPDGSTDTPRVEVDPKLFQAAETVRDGEVVPEPVKIGDRWAAVWRRGSMAAVRRTLEQESRTIRQVLMRKKLESQRAALLRDLKKRQLTQRNDRLLQYIDISPFGDVQSQPRPGVVPRGAEGKPTPGRSRPGFR